MLNRGVFPFKIDFSSDPEKTLQTAFRILKEREQFQVGDKVVIISDVLAQQRVDSIQIRDVPADDLSPELSGWASSPHRSGSLCETEGLSGTIWPRLAGFHRDHAFVIPPAFRPHRPGPSENVQCPRLSPVGCCARKTQRKCGM
jgi:hypothetical protein